MEKPLIYIKDLKKDYGNGVQTHALRGLSFDVYKGDFVAIMGPSGSGKSTLLHILGFLDRQTEGEYKFNGKSINDYSSEELAWVRNQEMGFIFQTFNLLPRISVFENVQLPLNYSLIKEKEWDNLVKKRIEEVGLTHRINYNPSQLSGGEKQRVAVARALINNPMVIFADEPTGDLDSKTGGKIMELIKNLNKQGHTIILITHETYTAEYADRIIHLKDGQIERQEKVKRSRNTKEDFIK